MTSHVNKVTGSLQLIAYTSPQWDEK